MLAIPKPTTTIKPSTNPWRGDLSPLGREAAPKPVNTEHQINRDMLDGACCAAEREQAPSPQVFFGFLQLSLLVRNSVRLSGSDMAQVCSIAFICFSVSS